MLTCVAGPAICSSASDSVETHAQYLLAAVIQRLFRGIGTLCGNILFSARSMASGQFLVRDRLERQDDFAATPARHGRIDDSKVGKQRSHDAGYDHLSGHSMLFTESQ
jgi:hypothetical protein